jgi:hypothetical protein
VAATLVTTLAALAATFSGDGCSAAGAGTLVLPINSRFFVPILSLAKGQQ